MPGGREGRGRGGRSRGRGRGRGYRRGGSKGNGSAPIPEDNDQREESSEPRVPKVALEILSARDVQEEEVGIKLFASPDAPGFGATLKHIYSDFNVYEVDQRGEVVRLTSQELPECERQTEAGCAATPVIEYSALPEDERQLVTMLTYSRLVQLAQKHAKSGRGDEAPANSSPGEVTVDVTKLDKECRKKMHLFVRSRFPVLQTRTEFSAGGAGEEKQATIKVI